MMSTARSILYGVALGALCVAFLTWFWGDD